MDDNSGINRTLRDNIETFAARRQAADESATLSQRISGTVTSFAGSVRFVVIHLALYGAWLALNLKAIPAIQPWDPSLAILALLASVEALFLSAFILIAQNRMATMADRRADLDLHISLLSEHELTRLADLTIRIAGHLGVPVDDPELHEVTTRVEPAQVLDEIERRSERPGGRDAGTGPG